MKKYVAEAVGDLVAPPPWLIVRELARMFFSPPGGTTITTTGGTRMTGVLVVKNGEAVAFVGTKRATPRAATPPIS